MSKKLSDCTVGDVVGVGIVVWISYLIVKAIDWVIEQRQWKRFSQELHDRQMGHKRPSTVKLPFDRYAPVQVSEEYRSVDYLWRKE